MGTTMKTTSKRTMVTAITDKQYMKVEKDIYKYLKINDHFFE